MNKFYKTAAMMLAAGSIAGCANMEAMNKIALSQNLLNYSEVQRVSDEGNTKLLKKYCGDNPTYNACQNPADYTIATTWLFSNNGAYIKIGVLIPKSANVGENDIIVSRLLDERHPFIDGFIRIAARANETDTKNCRMSGTKLGMYGVICKNETDNYDYHNDPRR